jgi:DNA-binding GntR family transcriptional regulator
VTILEPVSRESTASIVARRLRDAIVRGTLAPGAQLGEAQLAAQLGVSRGPLREAMQRLVQEGLVRSEPNRGLFVVELGDDDVRDIYLARAAIERAAVTAILDRDPAASTARLRIAHELMAAAARAGDLHALSDADLNFHQVLVEESGSPRLKRMHDTLLTESRMCLTALETSYAAADEVVQEHGGILDALAAKNRRRLDSLIRAHSADALARLIR